MAPLHAWRSLQGHGRAGIEPNPFKARICIARGKDVPFNPPAGHPLTGLPAIRAVYHVEQKDANAAPLLAKNIILRYYREGLNIDEPQAIANLAHFIGFEPEFILAGIGFSVGRLVAHCNVYAISPKIGILGAQGNSRIDFGISAREAV